ncbi:hypothetical protein DFR69_107384 [Nocardia neocaledoniensis]|uniref:Uncharacterized protein n=1 Tax=Nocardia neocaledoniensis TaxID=236511 RepID=A0A317NFT8_9NOCA|nr:hypothetical protein DFR69_107384 [Nocardia neocaledoniensis]
MNEIRRPINRIQHPQAAAFAADIIAFLAEEPDVRCLRVQEVLDTLLNRDIDIGDEISVTFG